LGVISLTVDNSRDRAQKQGGVDGYHALTNAEWAMDPDYDIGVTDLTRGQSNRSFKIAFIHLPMNEIWPPVSATALANSVELITDEIARRLARSHDVIAYCAHGKGQQNIEQFDGVEYRRVSTWLDRKFLHRGKIMRLVDRIERRNVPQPIVGSPLWYRHYIGEVVSDLSRQDCDIVHIMNMSQFVPVVRARLPRARIVLHMQAQWLEHLDAAVIERRISAADLVLGCSDFIAEGVRRRFPSFAQRCTHIYNGADITLFTKPPGVKRNPKQLLFVGRIAPEKGVHILLDAFRVVLEQHPDAHLKLIGPEKVHSLDSLLPTCDDPHVLEIEPYFRHGVYAELLSAKVSELPSDSVSFFNKGVKFGELLPHYHSASIFAFSPVWNDPSPLTIYEAAACGLPIVSTRSGGIPEIVEHGRTGLLVERSDAQALADAILQLLSDPDRRDAMAQAAFERVSIRFSWDRIAEDLLEKYERLFA
jgi:glycosyltransferase involved in cell wall biosynthesis